MSKVKWVEIARTSSKVRFEVLSEYLNDKGFENEVEFLEVSPVDFEVHFREAMEKYDSIRIGSPFGSQLDTFFHAQDSEIRFLGAADAVWKKEGEWRLMSSNHFGLRRIIHDIGQGFDFESSILVVGAGAGARVAVSVFVKYGFNKINITNKFVEQANDLIADLRRKYFLIDFEFVSEEKLVMLPGTNVVLVNTTPLVIGNDLLKELYYFNFLKASGIVIDFTFIPIDTPLVMEAEQIGIKTVRGYEVSSWGDMAWVENCFGLRLDREEYCERLKQKVSKIEFDLTPFLKE